MATTEKTEHVPVVHERPRSRWLQRFMGRNLDPFEEMDEMFERLMGRGRMPLATWLPQGWGATVPRVDVIDREQEIVVRAEVPGLRAQDLDVSLSGNLLTLRGVTHHEEKQEQGEYYYCETSQGEFARTLRLPAEVDAVKAKATYKDGIVELVLPKSEGAQRQKIEVTG